MEFTGEGNVKLINCLFILLISSKMTKKLLTDGREAELIARAAEHVREADRSLRETPDVEGLDRSDLEAAVLASVGAQDLDLAGRDLEQEVRIATARVLGEYGSSLDFGQTVENALAYTGERERWNEVDNQLKQREIVRSRFGKHGAISFVEYLDFTRSVFETIKEATGEPVTLAEEGNHYAVYGERVDERKEDVGFTNLEGVLQYLREQKFNPGEVINYSGNMKFNHSLFSGGLKTISGRERDGQEKVLYRQSEGVYGALGLLSLVLGIPATIINPLIGIPLLAAAPASLYTSLCITSNIASKFVYGAELRFDPLDKVYSQEEVEIVKETAAALRELRLPKYDRKMLKDGS